jgi:glycosyltransferase involved in cell wall biosynthesis
MLLGCKSERNKVMQFGLQKKSLIAIRMVKFGGGAESSVNNLVKFLKSNGINVRDLCFSEFKKNVNFMHKYCDLIRYIYQIRVESKNADYLLACVEGAPFLMAAIATIGMSKRPVLWLHCEPTEYLKFVSFKQRLLIWLSILIANNIICASPWYANYISNISKKRIRFLPNFVGSEPALTGAQDKYDIKRSNYIYVGSLSKLKNISACFSFLALLGAQKHTCFDIYGDGSERGNLIKESIILQNTCFVSFKGHVPVDWQSHSAKSILLVPSFTEALPMVIVEALSHGIPVITNKYKGYEYFSMHDGLVESVEFNCPSAVKGASEILGNLSSSEYNRRFTNTKLFLSKNFDNTKNFLGLMEFFSTMHH